MSKIKNGGLDQYGAEPFEQQQRGIEVVYYDYWYLLAGSLKQGDSEAGTRYWSTGRHWTTAEYEHLRSRVGQWRNILRNRNIADIRLHHRRPLVTSRARELCESRVSKATRLRMSLLEYCSRCSSDIDCRSSTACCDISVKRVKIETTTSILLIVSLIH